MLSKTCLDLLHRAQKNSRNIVGINYGHRSKTKIKWGIRERDAAEKLASLGYFELVSEMSYQEPGAKTSKGYVNTDFWHEKIYRLVK
jgi:hypothetical protein